jgi:hypothetical protein
MMWLLAVYGVVGALYPVLIVADHIGTTTVRWQPSAFYPLVWGILLASFGALTIAGSIGAHRTVSGRDAPVAVPAGL